MSYSPVPMILVIVAALVLISPLSAAVSGLVVFAICSAMLRIACHQSAADLAEVTA